MFRLFITLSCLLFPLLSIAAKVVVKGNASTYPGQYISVYEFDDLLSWKRKLLASSLIGENGEFELSFDIAETQKMILAINTIEAVLYAEPGNSYNVDYPSFQGADLRRFDKTEVDLRVYYLPDNDLNLLIRSFDDDMDAFIEEHYFDIASEQFRGSEVFKTKLLEKGSTTDIIPVKNKNGPLDSLVVTETKTSIDSLTSAFFDRLDMRFSRFYTNTFFAEYVRYSKAQIELIAGIKKTMLYKEYFMSQKVQFRNPAYMQFFDTFYINILAGYPFEKQEQIYKAVNADKNGSLLSEIFHYDSLYLSDDIRTMAMIKGLREIYYNKNFVQSSVASTLKSYATSDLQNTLKKMADNVLANLTRARSGWQIEDFTLLDEKNEKWTLSEHSGKYIYFIFFAQWCSSCIKEMQILEKIYDTYRKEIDFVAISMDSNYDDFKKYLQQHGTQKYTFLYGGTDVQLREKFNLRALPFTLLLTPEGKVLNDYTRKPGEGANLDFEKIKNLLNKKTGSGTWND